MALCVRTGERLMRYDEAPNLGKPNKRTPRASAKNATFNLSDGKLIVKVDGTLAVLDAESGKKLWQVDYDGKLLFPSVADSLLVVAKGSGLATSRAHGQDYDADLTGLREVVGYDLATGAERWSWKPEHDTPYLTMLNINKGSVWVDYDKKKDGWFLVRIDPKTGQTIWQTKHKELGPTDKFARLFVFDQVAFLSRGAQDGYRFNLADGKVLDKWSTKQGGCHAPRATSTSMFHSGVSVTGNGTEHQKHWAHMIAGRCHIGAFPGHGMLLAGDSGCNCDPFIRGLAAYGPEPEPAMLETVTITGTGKAAAPATGDVWTTAFRDNKRSAWSESTLSQELKIAWTTQTGKASVQAPLDIRRLDITAGPMGAPTIAGMVSVVTKPHDHGVIGLSVDDGRELWRHRAMGRLDGAVSLAGGMAVFGSAAGWVEAISLTDGQLVWKTLVAPAVDSGCAPDKLKALIPLSVRLPCSTARYLHPVVPIPMWMAVCIS